MYGMLLTIYGFDCNFAKDSVYKTNQDFMVQPGGWVLLTLITTLGQLKETNRVSTTMP